MRSYFLILRYRNDFLNVDRFKTFYYVLLLVLDKKQNCYTQNGQLGNRVHILSHHLSLPNPASDMSAMDKFLRFPDSVPCKIRAKRGCATHPRSVAERVGVNIGVNFYCFALPKSIYDTFPI